MDQDTISFGKLFDGYRQQFVRFANSYVRDWQTAEDFVMDAMLEYWQNRDSLHDNSNVPAYIITIIRNRCLNWLCRQKVRNNASETIRNIAEWDLETRIQSLKECDPQILFSKEIRSIVSDTLKSLPPQTRRIFIMSRERHLSYKEIAALTGMSVKGVEFHIGKALKVLRHALKNYLGILVYFL